MEGIAVVTEFPCRTEHFAANGFAIGSSIIVILKEADLTLRIAIDDLFFGIIHAAMVKHAYYAPAMNIAMAGDVSVDFHFAVIEAADSAGHDPAQELLTLALLESVLKDKLHVGVTFLKDAVAVTRQSGNAHVFSFADHVDPTLDRTPANGAVVTISCQNTRKAVAAAGYFHPCPSDGKIGNLGVFYGRKQAGKFCIVFFRVSVAGQAFFLPDLRYMR